MGIRQ